ncbi:MAG: insulinase family protein [Sphingosinicella sp.]|nr:insulinase family protein [Sphingosinicella sp.]
MTLLRSFLPAFLLLFALPLQAAPVPGDGGWFYRGSDIPPDRAWTFGTLPNGLRYAVRRNALPAGQVAIRVRIDAGSLHEEDKERGWAHIIEHMAFRGTKSFEASEARHIWEKLGASFGSDTNASTTPTETVYMLDLPDADRGDLDLSLKVIAEMMDNARFDPSAVAAERKIVLAEKERRPELGYRMVETSWPLQFAGLKIADRMPIGTEATIESASAEGLRAFYERWYRPDRATVVITGDADPKLMVELIEAHFGGWKAEGPTPREPDYGKIARVESRVATLAYPAAPYSASLMWLRPYEKLPNTKLREKDDLARSLATRILNRRLEAKARGEASFVGASIGQSRQTDIAEYTQLSVLARDDKWQSALAESFAIISDALASPPSQAEIAREISNLRTSGTSAVEGEATVKSPQRAQQMVNALDGNSVVATAASSLALIEEFVPQMQPVVVGAAMRELFTGSGPRMVLLSPQNVSQAVAEAALTAAEKSAPATRVADRAVTFDDLPKLGPPGREISRQRIEDMDVTIVRFANGSSLVFKRTDYEKGSVQVALRFGKGLAALPTDRPSLHALGGIISQTGIGNLDLDAMERLLTGRKMSMSFGVQEETLVLYGVTNGTELGDQMRLLATKLAFPRWDPALFARTKTGALQGYDLVYAAAASRGGREFGKLAHGGDKRWAPLEKQMIETLTLADLTRFFDPLLAAGPIEAIIVGDVDLETAVEAMRRSAAGLPPRAEVSILEASRRVLPPTPNPAPLTLTHQGDPAQAFALIGWSTFGGLDRIKERRALSIAANLFQVRLFDRFREVEGASYSPSARSSNSSIFPDWGIFYAASELRPASAPDFFRAAREIIADLGARPVEQDEFERAINPVNSGIQRRLRTNSYWMGALEDWTSEPRAIEDVRSYVSDYGNLTAEDVRAAVAAHVTEAGDWSMLVLPAKAQAGGK